MLGGGVSGGGGGYMWVWDVGGGEGGLGLKLFGVILWGWTCEDFCKFS